LLKRTKPEAPPQTGGRPRILVVDDHPDAARLLGKLLRSSGYEVAEVADHQIALITLLNEPQPISAVVASFYASGTGACVKLLDAVRSHPEPRVNSVRMVLIIDTPRQQMFTWQAGVDDILLRPYEAAELRRVVDSTVRRPDNQRAAYRGERLDALRHMAHAHGEVEGRTVAEAARFS
jgi:DNA-binding response OmpR family regulator